MVTDTDVLMRLAGDEAVTLEALRFVRLLSQPRQGFGLFCVRGDEHDVSPYALRSTLSAYRTVIVHGRCRTNGSADDMLRTACVLVRWMSCREVVAVSQTYGVTRAAWGSLRGTFLLRDGAHWRRVTRSIGGRRLLKAFEEVQPAGATLVRLEYQPTSFALALGWASRLHECAVRTHGRDVVAQALRQVPDEQAIRLMVGKKTLRMI